MRPRTPEESLGTKDRFLLTLVVALASCTAVQAQNTPATQSTVENHPKAEATGSPESQAKSQAGQTASPLVLKDVGPANTDGAAATVAKNLARQKHSQSKSQAQDRDAKPIHEEPATVAERAVVEFQPAPAGGSVDKESKPVSSKEGRHPERRVHGEVYGAAGAGGHATSEAVGVTSKDKKTSVYIGSDQTNLSSPQGH
jgi:hypothetical protein